MIITTMMITKVLTYHNTHNNNRKYIPVNLDKNVGLMKVSYCCGADGSLFGKSSNGGPEMTQRNPNRANPSHHAPNQPGSLGLAPGTEIHT